jgi:hypothetical protein
MGEWAGNWLSLYRIGLESGPCDQAPPSGTTAAKVTYCVFLYIKHPQSVCICQGAGLISLSYISRISQGLIYSEISMICSEDLILGILRNI